MGLKVWLPLDGNLKNNGYADIAVTSSDLTVENAGKIGKCFSFDGASSYIKLSPAPFDDSATEYSFACWMKPTDYNQSMCLFNNRTAGNAGGFFILLGSGQYYFDTGGRWLYPAEYPTAGKWAHLAITWKKGGLKRFYLNGALVADVNSGSNPTDVANAEDAYIGASLGPAMRNYYYKGCLNDIRIYDHELSAAEVREIARGLVLHYKLDDIQPNPNMLFDTNVSSLTKVYGPGNRVIANEAYGTHTHVFEEINDPPVPGIRYGVRENVTVANRGHAVTFYEDTIDITIGKTYTMSCYARNTCGNTGMKIRFWYGSIDYRYTDFALSGDAKWHQYSLTFTPAADDCGTGKTRIYCGGLVSVGEILICGWKLEEGETATPWIPNEAEPQYGLLVSGSVCDSSGHGRHGTITGTVGYSTDAPRFGGVALLGSNGLITTDSPGAYVRAASFWIKTAFPDSGVGAVVWADYQSKLAFGFSAQGDVICWCWADNTTLRNVMVRSDIKENAWNHIVVQYNESGDNIEMYVNGTIADLSGRDSYFKHATDTLMIGGRSTGTSKWGGGLISDFRMYAERLKADQIAELYQTGAKIDRNGNIHAYEFEEKSRNMMDLTALTLNNNAEFTYIPNGVRVTSTSTGAYRNIRLKYDAFAPENGKTYQISAHAKVNSGHGRIAVRNRSNSIIIDSTGGFTGEKDVSFLYAHDSSIDVYFSLFVTMSEAEDGDVEYTNIMITEYEPMNTAITKTGRIVARQMFEDGKGVVKFGKTAAVYTSGFVEM